MALFGLIEAKLLTEVSPVRVFPLLLEFRLMAPLRYKAEMSNSTWFFQYSQPPGWKPP